VTRSQEKRKLGRAAGGFSAVQQILFHSKT